MSNNHRTKFLHTLIDKKADKGFTLLELLIVMLMSTVLALIAYPSMISSAGKAREAEAMQVLSSIGQGQQAYFFENSNFANQLEQLDVIFDKRYYRFEEPDVVSVLNPVVKHKAMPVNSGSHGTREYELGVYYNSGAFQVKLCRGNILNDMAVAPDISTSSCVEGTELR